MEDGIDAAGAPAQATIGKIAIAASIARGDEALLAFEGEVIENELQAEALAETNEFYATPGPVTTATDSSGEAAMQTSRDGPAMDSSPPAAGGAARAVRRASQRRGRG